MLYTFLKRLLIFSSFLLVTMAVQSQQVTKDQLLNLFYQANTALNNNQTEAAVEFYNKILKLSPNLPEPYLQLGNIYSTMGTDAASLEKACKYYAKYLELNKDAKDADLLRNKISELTAKVEQLNNPGQLVAVNEQLELADNPPLVVNPDSHKEELTELLVENVKKEEVKSDLNDSIEIISDTIPAVLPSNDSGINLMTDSLIGKWTSAEIGIDGREMWIFEIKKSDNQYFILLNDSSYVLRSKSNLKDVFANGMQIFIEGNELVVNYKKEQEKSKEKIGNLTKDGFGEVLGGLLNVDLKLDLFNEEEPIDTIVATDTVPIVSTKIIDAYKISMHFDGFKMYGSMTHQIIEKDTIERMISESVDLLELFKAPDDYLGYTYQPSGLLSEMPELKNLYTRKLQAAMSDASALNDLGCMYVLGIGVRRNLKMAVSKFDEARVKKNLFATLNLANLYVNAIGVEQNLPKAREYYKQIHERGFSDAMVMCGDTYISSKATDEDYKMAFDCYVAARLRGSVFGICRLAQMYKEGLGTEKNVEKALEYYQMAVDKQYPEAMTDMALLYKEGILLGKDHNKALELLTRAAEKGDARAMYELYQINLRGDGVKPDFKYAKGWLHKYMMKKHDIFVGFKNLIESEVKVVLSSNKE